MNRRRIATLERLLGTNGVPACRCLLIYQAGGPAPVLTGTCPQCGLARRGKNILVQIEEVVIESREKVEPFGTYGRYV